MPSLWKAKTANVFYLLDDDTEWPPGDLELVSLRKQERSVDPAAVEAHRVPSEDAKKLAIAEMTRFKEATQKGISELAEVAKTIRKGAWALKDSGLPDLSKAPRPPTAQSLAERLKPQVDALASAIDGMLKDDGHTPAGQARLKAIAEAVRDNGGPDWTSNPGEIPTKLRAALSNPDLLPSLKGLLQQVRQEAPVPKAADPSE
ncbi:MAG: hypothetical protein AB8H79_11885 [Myxococcota bacterium]